MTRVRTGTIRCMPRRRSVAGLSLVELLVVVAVTSVLTVVVMRSAACARQCARRVACTAGLRQLAFALPAYADCHAGRLPPGPIERGFWPHNPDRGSPFEPYDRHRIGSGNLSSRDGWYGFGLLWKCRYMSDGRLYYCPAAGSRGGITAARAWPRCFNNRRDPADGKTRIFSTYAYRGGLSSHAGRPEGPLNVYRFSGRTAVLADNPCAGRRWHDGGYNIAYLDGHVRFAALAGTPVPAGRLDELWQAVGEPREAAGPDNGANR